MTAVLLPRGSVWCEEALRGSATRAEESAAGRVQAAAALGRLGVPGVVGRGARGEPLFPAGVCGSIAHAGGLVVAAAARTRGRIAGLGVDVHRPTTADDEIGRLVASGRERTAAGLAGSPQVAVGVLFAIKEAVFKAVSPATDRWLEFEDVHVLLLPGGRAAVRVRGLAVSARWSVRAGVVRAAALLAT